MANQPPFDGSMMRTKIVWRDTMGDNTLWAAPRLGRAIEFAIECNAVNNCPISAKLVRATVIHTPNIRTFAISRGFPPRFFNELDNTSSDLIMMDDEGQLDPTKPSQEVYATALLTSYIKLHQLGWLGPLPSAVTSAGIIGDYDGIRRDYGDPELTKATARAVLHGLQQAYFLSDPADVLHAVPEGCRAAAATVVKRANAIHDE